MKGWTLEGIEQTKFSIKHSLNSNKGIWRLTLSILFSIGSGRYYYVFDWVSPTRSSNVRGWAEIIVCLGRMFYLHKHVQGRTVKCAVWRGEGGCKFVTHGWFDALYSFNLQFGLGKPPLYWFTRNKHSPGRQVFRHRQVHKQMFDGNTNTIKLSQLSVKHPTG